MASSVARAAARLVDELGGLARAVGEADELLAVRGVGRIELEEREARAVGRGRVAERPAVEPAQPLEALDLLAARVGDGEQRLVGARELGGVVGALVVRQAQRRDRPPGSACPAAARRSRPGDGGARCGLACSTSRYDAKVAVGVAEARLLNLTDAEQQLLAARPAGSRRRPGSSSSRRSASTRPAQSWRASATRASALSALSLAGSASTIAPQVRAAAAASPTRSSSSCAMRKSCLTRSPMSGARSARACSSFASSGQAFVCVKICSSAASASSSCPSSAMMRSAKTRASCGL